MDNLGDKVSSLYKASKSAVDYTKDSRIMNSLSDKASTLYNASKDTVEYTKDKVSTADPQKVKMAGCVVAGLATGGAALYIVPAAAGIIGFGKIGIAGKSLAASWMSWGHGMFAVSTLQSIGAAGLGAMGATAAGLLGYKAAERITKSSEEPKAKSKL